MLTKIKQQLLPLLPMMVELKYVKQFVIPKTIQIAMISIFMLPAMAQAQGFDVPPVKSKNSWKLGIPDTTYTNYLFVNCYSDRLDMADIQKVFEAKGYNTAYSKIATFQMGISFSKMFHVGYAVDAKEKYESKTSTICPKRHAFVFGLNPVALNIRMPNLTTTFFNQIQLRPIVELRLDKVQLIATERVYPHSLDDYLKHSEKAVKFQEHSRTVDIGLLCSLGEGFLDNPDGNFDFFVKYNLLQDNEKGRNFGVPDLPQYKFAKWQLGFGLIIPFRNLRLY